MPIRPELLVRNAEGIPQPPQDLVNKLKEKDPRIGLFYTKASWAITEAWKEDDPRRQWIQDGSMQPEFAFDICGYLPLTCSLDEAPAYIERELRAYTEDHFKAIRSAVSKWDEVQDKKLEERLVESTMESLDTSKVKPQENQSFVPQSAPVPAKPARKK